MRTIWLVVIAVSLGAGAAGRAQDSMMKKLLYQPNRSSPDAWAVQHVETLPAPAPAGPTQAAPVVVPPAAPMVAHAPVGAPAGGAPHGSCACGHGRGHPFCDKLLAWLCYRPLGCCCNGCAHGCRPAPLYMYTFDECPGCHRTFTLPDCYREGGVVRGLINGEHPFAGRGGSAPHP
jgi:hypothetical protein